MTEMYFSLSKYLLLLQSVIVAKSVNFLNLLDSFFSEMSFRRKSHVYEHPISLMAVVECHSGLGKSKKILHQNN